MVPQRGPSPQGEGPHHSAGADVPASVITSRGNPLIRDLRALFHSSRRRPARCVVEGWRFLEAAVASGAHLHLVVYTPAAAAHPRAGELRERLHSMGVRLVLVSPYVFKSLTQVESPQGVLGVARRPPEASVAILRDRRALLVVLDGIQDPGNVGAVLRTAAAADATGGVIVGAAADPFGAKAIRASAGAVFRLPLLFFKTAAEATAAFAEHRVRLLIADPRGERLDSEISYGRRPLALVFGSEGAGAAPEWAQHGITVRLPMAGAVESLGVAAAAAVLLYRAGHPISWQPTQET
jgi:TrmH family RNA methyltransferase